jgi:hypothetical protein
MRAAMAQLTSDLGGALAEDDSEGKGTDVHH